MTHPGLASELRREEESDSDCSSFSSSEEEEKKSVDPKWAWLLESIKDEIRFKCQGMESFPDCSKPSKVRSWIRSNFSLDSLLTDLDLSMEDITSQLCHWLTNEGGMSELRESKCDEIRSQVWSSMDPPSEITEIRQRRYQREVFEKARLRNSIVFMPTGAGKTRVAVALIQDFLRSSQTIRRCIAFLAPTVPLVLQHCKRIRSLFKSRIRLKSVCGDSKIDSWSPEKWKMLFEFTDVLVMTPQSLVVALSHGHCRIHSFSLLIFDECHHASNAGANRRVFRPQSSLSSMIDSEVISSTNWVERPSSSSGRKKKKSDKGGHPYFVILSEYYRRALVDQRGSRIGLPHILGLSASPVKQRTRGTDEVYSKARDLTRILDSQLIIVERNRDELAQVVSDPVWRMVYFVSQKPGLEDALPVPEQPKHLRKVVNAINALNQSMGGFAAHLAMQSWKSRLGLRRKLLENGAQLDSESAKSELEPDSLWKVSSEERYGQSKWDYFKTDFENGKLSHKTRKLLETVKDLSNRTGIIFVQSRIHCATLCRVLSVRLPQLRFGYFTGTNNDGWAVTSSERRKVLNEFRKGDIDWVLCTSIGEEGLDIRDCSVVLRWDLPQTAKTQIQSRGRARQKDSVFVFMVEVDNEEQFARVKQFVRAEADMLEFAASEHASEQPGQVSELIDKYFSPVLDGERLTIDDTGAFSSVSNAKSMIYHFCQAMKYDVPREMTRELVISDDRCLVMNVGCDSTKNVFESRVDISDEFPFALEMREKKLLTVRTDHRPNSKTFSTIYVRMMRVLHECDVLDDHLIPSDSFCLTRFGATTQDLLSHRNLRNRLFKLPPLKVAALYAHPILSASSKLSRSKKKRKGKRDPQFDYYPIKMIRMRCDDGFNFGLIVMSDDDENDEELQKLLKWVNLKISLKQRMDDVNQGCFKRTVKKNCPLNIDLVSSEWTQRMSAKELSQWWKWNTAMFELFQISDKNGSARLEPAMNPFDHDGIGFKSKDHGLENRCYLIVPLLNMDDKSCDQVISDDHDRHQRSTMMDLIDTSVLRKSDLSESDDVRFIEGESNVYLCYDQYTPMEHEQGKIPEWLTTQIENRRNNQVDLTDEHTVIDYSLADLITLDDESETKEEECQKEESDSDATLGDDNEEEDVSDCETEADAVKLLRDCTLSIDDVQFQDRIVCRGKGVRFVDVCRLDYKPKIHRETKIKASVTIRYEPYLKCLSFGRTNQRIFHQFSCLPSILFHFERQLRIAAWMSILEERLNQRCLKYEMLLSAVSKRPVNSVDRIWRWPQVFRKYEGFEWIGDALLKWFTSMDLFCRFPSDNEAGLTDKKASVISNEYLLKQCQNVRFKQTSPVYFAEYNVFNFAQWNPPTHIPRSYESCLDNLKVAGKVGADLMESLIGVCWMCPFISEADLSGEKDPTSYDNRMSDLSSKESIDCLSVALSNLTHIMDGFDLRYQSSGKDETTTVTSFRMPELFRLSSEEHSTVHMCDDQSSEPDSSVTVQVSIKASNLAEFICERTGHPWKDDGSLKLLRRIVDFQGRECDFSKHPALSFQRLEFLGDAILDLIVSHHLAFATLFGSEPGVSSERDEGYLSEKRQSMVCNEHLMCVALKSGVHRHLNADPSTLHDWEAMALKIRGLDRMPVDETTDKRLSDVMEALVCAVFLDSNPWVLSPQDHSDALPCSLDLKPVTGFIRLFIHPESLSDSL